MPPKKRATGPVEIPTANLDHPITVRPSKVSEKHPTYGSSRSTKQSKKMVGHQYQLMETARNAEDHGQDLKLKLLNRKLQKAMMYGYNYFI